MSRTHLWYGESTFHTAFTLLELLIVVSIISILASLLLPALAKAKEKGRDATCRSNLRQLHLAWGLYNHDHERFPINVQFKDVGKRVNNWVGNLVSYETVIIPPAWPITDNTNDYMMMHPVYGALGMFAGNAKIYKCPSDTSYVMIEGKNHPRNRSYSMNGFVGFSNAQQDSRLEYFWREQDFRYAKPVDIFLFLDEHPDSIDDGEFNNQYDPSIPRIGWANVPGSHHSKGCNLIYVDGHLERKKWQDRRTVLPIRRIRNHNTMQSGNRDLNWIFSKSTVVLP